MPRFFVLPEKVGENQIILDGDNAHHIKNVLRLKVGEEVTVCDSCGYDYQSKILQIASDSVIAEILQRQKTVSEPSIAITLYQALPKGDKMDFIVQKCVELGIDRIVPMNTKRCIVKINQKEEKKISRWQKISVSAAKQSGRGKIPEISPVMNFTQALEDASRLSKALIPYELEQTTSLHQLKEDFCGNSIGIFIGPEGGFSVEEIEQAIKAKIMPVTLGKRILRTETAGMVTLAILLYELEK